MNQFHRIVLLAFTCSLSLACDDDASSASAQTQQDSVAGESSAAEAKKLFQATCVSCHGPQGQGNGPASGALDPKPPNFSESAWQSSVSDDDIAKVIVSGGMGVGKSPLMPAQPQLKAQPEVLEELVKLIRAFGESE